MAEVTRSQEKGRSLMKLRTEFWPKPGPDRGYDWYAVDDEAYDGNPGCPVGTGPTQEAAIADLMEQLS